MTEKQEWSQAATVPVHTRTKERELNPILNSKRYVDVGLWVKSEKMKGELA